MAAAAARQTTLEAADEEKGAPIEKTEAKSRDRMCCDSERNGARSDLCAAVSCTGNARTAP